MINRITAAGLRAAAIAVDKLDAQGINVVGYRSDMRKPVLVVDRPPAFAHGVVKSRRYLRSGAGAGEVLGDAGVVRTYACPFYDCQLEWNSSELAAREVAHG